MTDEEFLAFVGPAAYEIERTRGYPMEALLAQVHLESNGLAEYPAGSNNVLGIKWNGTGEYVTAATEEQNEAGEAHAEVARWQVFPSVYDCLLHWADLMDKPWYKQAQPYKGDWAAFLALIWFDGERRIYATDSLYLWKAVKRAAEVGIPKWCTKYRHRMQEPAVRVLIGGEEQPGYHLADSSVVGKARPFLIELKALGYSFNYDWRQKLLQVTRPTKTCCKGCQSGGQ